LNKEVSVIDSCCYIGLQIRRRRKALRWTQGRLAREAGVSRVSVVRWEKGETIPGVKQLEILSGLFGVRILDLCGDPEQGTFLREAPADGAREEEQVPISACKNCTIKNEWIVLKMMFSKIMDRR